MMERLTEKNIMPCVHDGHIMLEERVLQAGHGRHACKKLCFIMNMK